MVILNFLAGLQPRCLVSRIVAITCVTWAIILDLGLRGCHWNYLKSLAFNIWWYFIATALVNSDF